MAGPHGNLLAPLSTEPAAFSVGSIRVRPAGRIGAKLDIRAKSRNGENDMATTALLVRDYLKSLK